MKSAVTEGVDADRVDSLHGLVAMNGDPTRVVREFCRVRILAHRLAAQRLQVCAINRAATLTDRLTPALAATLKTGW